jgi:hypothetical protein
MDTSWWPALGAVVVLALVAALVDGWGRGGRPRAHRAHGAVRGAARPRAAEIWWAGVPHRDRAGATEDGPCLVLAVRGDRARVARITEHFHEERSGVIPLPPGAVTETHGRASYVETDDLCEVPLDAFRHRVGVVDPALWDQLRHLAG